MLTPEKLLIWRHTMNNSEHIMKGECLCGAVRIQSKINTEVEVCHCGMCRRWSGGPLLAIHCGTKVKIEGENNIQVFNSSAWAERGFCKVCGTHIFYRLKHSNEYAVPAGLFQKQQDLKLTQQIFIDQKPSYYEFSNKTRSMTEAEVFQKYAPQ
jgi:hypothetical protein